MKLLLDENLSPRLVESLSDLYPGSEHVENAGFGRQAHVRSAFGPLGRGD